MSGHEAVIRAVGGQFPGGIVATYADSPLVLRKLLEAAQECDHRLALRTLVARLGERGVTVRIYRTSLIVTGSDERKLIVICQRAVFRWAVGEEIGLVTGMDRAVQDVADAAKGARRERADPAGRSRDHARPDVRPSGSGAVPGPGAALARRSHRPLLGAGALALE
ncbi:hypothetical protein AGRA3207_000085 [Actinomadura graeca]|uniref:Uncharacterized protein n=1 Tax=Actinomadura graeca TaxID=2750812 RepID=A0ABX8QLU8_9ACTN|nr:hypothetical protein [Actinomadura graeca]QXJ19532.1 hypothetical protein AGRA3207_000085 [Actinomadura graeca]